MHKLAALLGVLFVAVAVSPAVYAIGTSQDTSLYAVITYKDGTYDVGSTVDVTVHVFEAGEYAHVDSVLLMVGNDYRNPHKVPVTEGAKGRWTGNFTILGTDVSGVSSSFGSRYVPLSATVSRGGSQLETAYVSISLAEKKEEPLVVKASMSPPTAYGVPGGSRTITWEIRQGPTLVEPTTAPEVTVDSDPVGTPPVKLATGVYSYTYTFPTGNHSSSSEVNLDAKYKTANGTVLDASDSVTLFVNYLHVWANRIGPVTFTGATFDLYVSNASGKAVEGASVKLSYSYLDDDSNPIPKNVTGSTDVNGMARVELSYNDLGQDQYSVEVGGNVSAQGKVQDIRFTLFVRSPATSSTGPPSDSGLDFVPSKLPVYQFAKTVHYAGTAYYDASSLNNARVYTYVSSPHEVILKGNQTTTPAGALALDFMTPSKGTESVLSLDAHLVTGVTTGTTTAYYTDDESVSVTNIDIEAYQSLGSLTAALNAFKDTAVGVKVAALKKATPVTVTITFPGNASDWRAQVFFGSDSNPGSMGLVPEWTYWTSSSGNGLYGDYCELKDGKYQGTIFIPDNLPDKHFFVYAALASTKINVITDITDFKDYIKTNHVDGLEVGKSGGGGGGGGGNGGGALDNLMDTKVLGISLLYLIIIIIIIVVAGLAAGMMISRSKRSKGTPEAPEGAAVATEEGPRFASGPGPAAPMPAPTYPQPYASPAEPQQAYQAQPQYAPQPQPAPRYEQPQPQPQPQYAQPQPIPQPMYSQPQPQYAPQPQPQQQYVPPPAPQPQYAPPPPPQPQPQPQPQYAQPPQMQAQPPRTAASPAQPAMTPRPTAPAARPAAPATAATTAAAPAAGAEGMMTIKCQKCGTKLTIPRKRPIKVTCPTCGANGVLR